jgi:predicted amidohydrolase
MSRPVTVSCLSAVPLALGESVPLDEVVEREIAHWAERLEAVLPDEPDIIVLPEAADRPDSALFGPDRQAEYYRERGMRIREYFSARAAENHCYIAYSSVLSDGDGTRNATQIIDRTGGIVGEYDKTYVTMPENEEVGIAYGDGAVVLDLDFGRVGSAICFDLNFEDLRAQYMPLRPELILFSSEYHGSIMQNYWAYSLRAYFAACIRPPAPSAIISPLGEVLQESTNYFPHVTQRINLDYAVAHLDGNWEKFAAARKKYGTLVGVHDPGRLGSVLLTSESPDFSAADIVAEFEIELLDDFLARCRRHRSDHPAASGVMA